MTLVYLRALTISDLQIGVRGRLRVRVLSSEHAHFEKFSPAKPKARAQYGKRVLVVVLVLQSEGRYCSMRKSRTRSRSRPRI